MKAPSSKHPGRNKRTRGNQEEYLLICKERVSGDPQSPTRFGDKPLTRILCTHHTVIIKHPCTQLPVRSLPRHRKGTKEGGDVTSAPVAAILKWFHLRLQCSSIDGPSDPLKRCQFYSPHLNGYLHLQYSSIDSPSDISTNYGLIDTTNFSFSCDCRIHASTVLVTF